MSGIAKIAPYPLPLAADIPRSRLSWTPDAARAALLVHDMQRYFLAPFPAEGAPAAPMIEAIARLIETCRKAGVPVFYTAQKGDQDPRDRGLQADLWGPGMRAVPEHEEIVQPLAPGAGDIVLVKHRYSAFQRSNLETLMRARGRDQLIVCGVYAHIGCLLTVAEAFQRDIEPFLVADATGAFSQETHDLALRSVADCCGVTLVTDEVLAALGIAPAGEGALTLEKMRADVAAILHESPDDITEDDHLPDLGLDSMRVMTLLARWNAEAGIALEFSDIAEHLTLKGWWSVVEDRQVHARGPD